jgi:site-specific recombinase XerD
MKIDIFRFEDFLQNKNLKERTIENYIYYFNKFTFDVFNQETVSRYLANKTNRNSIARSFLVNLQRFLIINYKELGFSQESRGDIAEVELPKLTGRVKQRIIKPIPHEHIQLLETSLETEQLKLQLLLSYYCALRLGELLKITILSFDWAKWKKNPSKMGECRVYGKGDKEGIALVPSVLMKRIAIYIRSKKFSSLDSKIFVRGNAYINLKNKGRTWQIKLRNAGVKAGITKLDEEGKIIQETAIHPHRLRHSYASYLLNEKGLNLKEVQEVLRHASLQSTQIYTHINKDALKEKLEA